MVHTYKVRILDASLTGADEFGPLHLKWSYEQEETKTLCISGDGGIYQWEELIMNATFYSKQENGTPFQESVSKITIESENRQIGYCELDLSEHAGLGFRSVDNLNLKIKSIGTENEIIASAILGFSLHISPSPIETETEQSGDESVGKSDLMDQTERCLKNYLHRKNLSFVDPLARIPLDLGDKDDMVIQLNEKIERLKQDCQKTRQKAEVAAQHGLDIFNEREQFETHMKEEIGQRDAKIERLDRKINDLKENLDESEKTIKRLQSKKNNKLAEIITKDAKNENLHVWFRDELCDKYCENTCQNIQNLRSKIDNERKQYEDFQKLEKSKFTALKKQHKGNLQSLEKNMQRCVKNGNLDHIKRLLANLDSRQNMVKDEAEEMENTNLKEELRQESCARRALEVENTRLKEELRQVKSKENTLSKEQNIADEVQEGCDDANKEQNSLVWSPFSRRSSFSRVENQRDQYKTIIDDHDNRMVTEKNRVFILHKQLGSLVSLLDATTEEGENLRKQLQEKRYEIKDLETKNNASQRINDEQVQEINILKRHRDMTSTSGREKTFIENIKLVETKLLKEQKKQIKNEKNIIDLREKYRTLKQKSFNECKKYVQESKKMTGLTRELADCRRERGTLLDVVTKLQGDLKNGADMANNYEQMSEELAIKTREIANLVVQRMALEDVLRSSNVNILVDEYMKSKKKKGLSQRFSDLSRDLSKKKLFPKILSPKSSYKKKDSMNNLTMCDSDVSNLNGNQNTTPG